MLITKTAQVSWNSKNKKHYTQLGYAFSRMGDKFSVRVEDLSSGSNANVVLKCDYCGKKFINQWVTYIAKRRREIIHKDACRDCCELKANEAISQKYGSHSNRFFASNDKRKQTNIDRYGFENPFANDEVKSKIVASNIKRYGVKYNQQSSLVREKTENTCLKKYGVKNYVELFRGKFIKDNSPVWKGGVSHHRLDRSTYEYSTWRKGVFTKDKYTCVKCGAKNGYGKYVELNAHHIRNWKDNELLRYDIQNGITLCSNCHNSFHSKFGKRNTNELQLAEFLQIR